MTFIVVIAALSAVGALGDTFIRLAGESSPSDLRLLALAALLYVLSVPGWLFVMKQVPLSAVGALYAASTVLILTGVGVFGFHERLNISEITGIALALAAVAILRRVL